MTTDTAQFHFERAFPLPPDQIWHLLTDGKMRERWGAPSDGTVLIMTVSDFKLGGVERHRCGPADNPEFEAETRWYRIEAPTDAAFTETVLIGGGAIATQLVTYRLAATDQGTALSITVAVSSFVGAEASSEFQAGWEGGLRNLEALVAQQAG